MNNYLGAQFTPRTFSSNIAGVFQSGTKVTKQAIVIYAGLMICVIDLASFTLSHTGRSAWEESADPYQPLRQKLADGKNFELHISDQYPDKSVEASPFIHIYYPAAYLLYPRRTYVGSDDHIINSSKDVQAADHVPSAEWLHAHQISNLAVVSGTGTIPDVHVEPVP